MSGTIKMKCGASLVPNNKTSCYTFNLNPTDTCRHKPCYKRGCYGLQNVFNPVTGKRGARYTSCTTSWNYNYDAIKYRPGRFAEEFVEIVKKKKFKYFRCLSIGDLTPQLMDVIKEVTPQLPDTKFLLFTKEYQLGIQLYKKFPNLEVIFSTWPNWDSNQLVSHLRKAVVIPEDLNFKGTKMRRYTFLCRGECRGCRICWNRSADVAFRAHGSQRNKIFEGIDTRTIKW